MKKTCCLNQYYLFFFLIGFFGFIKQVSAQSVICNGADPFCSGTTYNFPATTSNPTIQAEDGPNYGCLGSQPNPAWYYLQIGQSGNIIIYMHSEPQGVDLDFAAWGPFTNQIAACNGQLTSTVTSPPSNTSSSAQYPYGHLVDCSFSANDNETFHITNALSGQYYILMITNYDNDPCNIIFSQTNLGQVGAGTSECFGSSHAFNNSPKCVGENVQLFAYNIPNATYVWSGPNNFQSTVQNPILNSVSLIGAGVYSVVITNGTQQFFDSTIVVIHSNPIVTIQGATICAGDSATLTAIGATTYHWNTNTVNSSINVSPLVTTTYSVIGTNNYGCRDTSFSTVIVNPILPVPIITQNGNILQSSSETNNQWYFNGNMISGAVFQYYTAIVPGFYEVEVTNTNGCTTHSGMFFFSQTYSVSGFINYNNSSDTPLSSVAINLINGATPVASVASNLSGNFIFTNIPNGTYTIVPTTTKPWSGVSATDALKIKRHVVGFEFITEPVRLTAADVNNSGNVSATDALKVSRRIIGLDNSFDRGDWVFEKPVTGGEEITVNNANITQDLYGLCTGDVNGSNNPSLLMKTSKIFLNQNSVIYANVNETFELPVKIAKAADIGAFQLFLNYPAENLEVVGVSMNGKDNNIIYHAANGELRIVWSDIESLKLNDNDVLVNLKIKVINDNVDIASFEIQEESEIADETANVLYRVDLNISNISIQNPQSIGKNEIENEISIYPNPANSKILIKSKSELMDAVISIYDYNSKIILQQTLQKNSNEISISELGIGMYFVKVQTKDNVCFLKFIKE